MPDRKIEVFRTGKEGLPLATGVIHDDETIEVFVAGQHATFDSRAELVVRCAELSSTGVDLVIDP